MEHDHQDISKFYTIDPKTVKSIFQFGGMPKPFVEHTKIFAETALMVRNPALEIIHGIRSADFQKPAVRYLLCILLILYYNYII